MKRGLSDFPHLNRDPAMQSAPCLKNEGSTCFHNVCIRTHLKREAMDDAASGGTNADLLILDDIKTRELSDGREVINADSLSRLSAGAREAVAAACPVG